MGGLILQQTRGIAFQIFDAKALPHLELRYGVAERTDADNAVGLARKLGVDPEALSRTVDAFNTAAHRGEYEPRRLDGRSTHGLEPPKSNWALTLDVPPFVAFTVTGGITYTYGGLKIGTRAEVLDHRDRSIPGLFAAGEIVGGIFLHNSLRAAGLMHGAVFGRLAGIHAARGR
jgi:tricarballylate dehydrogenase